MADQRLTATSPSELPPSDRQGHAQQPLNRRRALRVLGALAAAAAGAAAVSAFRPQDVDAYAITNEPSTDFAGPIRATGGNATVPDGAANIGNNTGSGVGVYGTTNGNSSAAGVYGLASGTSQGVWGICNGSAGLGGSYGVYGTSDVGVGVSGIAHGSGGTGVYGNTVSPSGYGVYGQNQASGIGVFGTSNGSSDNSPGVWGQNTNGGPAVVGFSPSGDGFSAVTATGTGCFGGASGTGTGVYAFSGGGTGLVAQTGGSGQNAGVFAGNVVVTGSLTVQGAKSAAVRGADGTLKRLYSLESPESWFEDFGKGELKGGTVTVPLASDFAAVVHGDDYHVFLTPRGESNGLYISQQNANGFTVQEQGGGTSNIGFSYRIVAKRKDIAGTRLEHVEDVTPPTPPAFPRALETPPTPATVSSRHPGP